MAQVLGAVIIACSFSCKQETADLRTMIASFQPAEKIEGISPARNPDAIFCRARLEGQIRNAIALPPGGSATMDGARAAGSRLRFSFGVLEQAIGETRGPVRFYLEEKDSNGNCRIVWEAALDPAKDKSDSGWHEAEVRIGDSPVNTIVFGTEIESWGAVFANPRFVSLDDRSRPSVMFLLIDALRPDHLGCYGYSRVNSLQIDETASRGARFETAITASPFTLTSIASIFSGLYPWDHGVIFTRDLRYPAEAPSLVEKFREAGYSTAAFSGTYFRFSASGFDRGFDVFDEACAESFFYESADCLVQKAGQWLDRHSDEPFFLYMHFADPHAPYYPPEPFRSRFSANLEYDHKAVELGDAGRFGDGKKWYQLPLRPTDRDIEYLKALYDGEIMYSDHMIGLMLSGLKSRSRMDNINILITADHGEAFYEHGSVEHRGLLYDEVLKVPLIIAGQGVPRGKMYREQVRTMDFMPTLLDLAGISLPGGIEGRSLVPLLQGLPLAAEPALSFRCLSLKKEQYEYSYRNPDEKLLLRLPEGKAELYDLVRDPLERFDLTSSDKERTGSLIEMLEGKIK